MCWRVSRLTLGAEVAAAVADGNTLNGSAADGTEVATQAVGNLKLKVGCPLFAAGAKVGVGAGPFITDG